MAAEVLDQLGHRGASFKDLAGGPWFSSGAIQAGVPTLMARVEPNQARALMPEPAADEATAAASNAGNAAKPKEAKAEAKPKSKAKSEGPPPSITFDQFAVVDLRCGLIVTAEAVEGAAKLLKLSVDLGEGAPRTIASGIAETFAPAELVGRRVIVVANLAPRTIRGIESRGMILASGEGKAIRLATLPEDVTVGSEIR
jgi:methionyl-tRNA synthetase